MLYKRNHQPLLVVVPANMVIPIRSNHVTVAWGDEYVRIYPWEMFKTLDSDLAFFEARKWIAGAY